MSEPLKLERVREYALPPDRVWRMLAHTERLHHMASLAPVEYAPPPEDRGHAWRLAWVKGIPRKWLRWREHPYDWERGRSLCVLREFEAGPLKRYLRGVRLEPTEKGTRVVAYAEISVRWGWLRRLVQWRGRRWLLSVHRYCSAFYLLHQRHKEFIYPQRSNHFVKLLGWERRLRAFAAATPDSGPLLHRLKSHLMHGTDEEVTHMRPKELAEGWAMPPRAIARLFHFAAAEGLLRAEWTVTCPTCRHPVARYDSLSSLPSRSRCAFCRLDFEMDVAECVELRYSVNPAIRLTVDEPLYRPGPAPLPHVAIQRYVPPGASVRIPQEWGDDRLLCRVLRTNETCRLSATLRHSARTTVVPVTFTDAGWVTDGVLFRPGKQEIELRNESTRAVVFSVEHVGADRQALTGLEALTDPDFRNLFPLEAPGPGRRLLAPSVTFLVVGIRNSTDHYAGLGDREALKAVHEYLVRVNEAVAGQGGAILKIQGDVVLATFQRAEHAVEAGFRALESVKPPFVLSLGIHRGPALLLSRGRQLDYFGETVNRAYQLQSESVGGDMVLSQGLFEDPAVQQALLHHQFDQEPREVFRNGPSGAFRICLILPMGKTG